MHAMFITFVNMILFIVLLLLLLLLLLLFFPFYSFKVPLTIAITTLIRIELFFPCTFFFMKDKTSQIQIQLES
jgi:hypothetical protein